MTLAEILEAIWRQPNRQMTWGRVPQERIVGQRREEPFNSGQDYVIVRLASMFLRDARVLWLKYSPLLHATVGTTGRTGTRTETAVIGPAQFADLASAPADRTVILRQRLAGPVVWRGGDLKIDTGLFAVSRDQAASALLTAIGQLAGLGMPGTKQTVELATIVKGGVESVLALQGTKPIIGVRETLVDQGSAGVGEQAGPCVLVGIAAPQNDIKIEEIWVKDGRLYTGTSAQDLHSYEKHDHILISVERGPPREDWRGLPPFPTHEAAFTSALAVEANAIDSAKEKVNAAFRAFDTDLSAAEELTDPDKERIRGQVIAELRRRIGMITDPLGLSKEERRSVGEIARRLADPTVFDFLDVGDIPNERAAPLKKGALPFEP